MMGNLSVMYGPWPWGRWYQNVGPDLATKCLTLRPFFPKCPHSRAIPRPFNFCIAPALGLYLGTLHFWIAPALGLYLGPLHFWNAPPL